jgi:anti-anti-sigma factor
MMHDPIPPFQVAVAGDGVVVTVTVIGEVDYTTAPALAKRLLEVAAAHPERLVLDLDQLFFTDVASARALDRTYKALEKQLPVILRASPRPSARRSSPSPGLSAVRARWVTSKAGLGRPGPRRAAVIPVSACSPPRAARCAAPARLARTR